MIALGIHFRNESNGFVFKVNARQHIVGLIVIIIYKCDHTIEIVSMFYRKNFRNPTIALVVTYTLHTERLAEGP